MLNYSIAIVGFGARGLSIIERFVSFSKVNPQFNLQINCYDPYPFGYGCHYTTQSDDMLVNTVASQITMFCDDSVDKAGPISLRGPTFYEWLKAKNEGEQVIEENGYYSRKELGEYLSWCLNYLCEHLPFNLKIKFHSSTVSDLINKNGKWLVYCDQRPSDQVDEVDFTVITTGHTRSMVQQAEYEQFESKTVPQTVINDPYPNEMKLRHLTKGMTVGIRGMGLTMNDILSRLTIGKGGTFKELDGKLSYHPSGNEPNIVMFSRSGIPLTARALNQKGASGQYKPKVLTMAFVKSLRNRGKIDFTADILPILIKEMSCAFYESYFRKRHGEVSAKLFHELYLKCAPYEEKQLVDQYVPVDQQFSFQKLSNPVPFEDLETVQAFGVWLRDYLDNDYNEACQGNMDSPMKAACDVIRDVRDILREAIDFGGLTESSHEWLMTEFVPVMNRLAVGPPKERVAELIALIEAGIVTCDFGPNPILQAEPEGKHKLISRLDGTTVTLDVVIKAQLSMHSPLQDSSALLGKLLEHGYAVPFKNGEYHPGGLAVDRGLQMIGANKEKSPNIWALGIPTEGAKFYTFVLPRPGVNSTALIDAGTIVNQIFKQMSSNIETTAKELVG